MAEIKPHLRHLFRTNTDEESRKGYLRLDMNECVPGLPADFVKGVSFEIDNDFLATYPEYKTLQEKIALHNNLQPKNISLSNGSDGAIKYIFDAYVSPGDRILLTDPTFAMYPVYCRMFNAEPIMVGYNPDLSFPVEEFIHKISPGIKIAVVVNPNNPTGSVVEPANLTSIIKKASDNNVLMIVDEAYFYFYPHSIINKIKGCENLIVLRTFSKLCGIAAARLGYVAACPKIIEDLRKVKPTYDVNSLAVLFAEKILDEPDVIQNLVRFTNEGKRYLTQKLSEKDIEYREGKANFILINSPNKVDKIVKKLAEKNILVKGGFKQDCLKDYIRVTVGNKIAMRQFWETFINIWASLK